MSTPAIARLSSIPSERPFELREEAIEYIYRQLRPRRFLLIRKLLADSAYAAVRQVVDIVHGSWLLIRKHRDQMFPDNEGNDIILVSTFTSMLVVRAASLRLMR